MPKPTNLPQWATSGFIVEPGGGKKATGWEPGELPPAEYFNWLQNLTYEWLQWLDGFSETTEGDWNLANTSTDANLSALEIASTAEEHVIPTSWKRLITFQAGADRWCGLYSGRLSNNNAFALVLNARWDTFTSNWVQTLSSRPSMALIWHDTVGDFRFHRQAAGSGPWASWSGRADVLCGGLDISGTFTAVNLALSGTITAASSTITGDLLVGDDLTVNGGVLVDDEITVNAGAFLQGGASVTGGDLTTSNNISIGGELVYAATKSRTRTYSGGGFHLEAPATRDHSAGTIVGNGGGATTHVLQLHMPNNTTLDQVLVEFDAAGASQVILNVRRMNSTPAAAADCRGAGALLAGGAGAGQTMTYVCDQNNTASPASAAYEVQVTLAANTGNVLKRVEVTYLTDRPMVF